MRSTFDVGGAGRPSTDGWYGTRSRVEGSITGTHEREHERGPTTSAEATGAVRADDRLLAVAKFGRGHGFGNRLFPWARARVFAHLHGAGFATPRWARLAIGPLLRGGVGLRAYRGQFLLIGLFRPRPGDLSRAAAQAFERRAVLLAESADLRSAPDATALAKGPAVVRFEGYRGFFAPLLGWSRFLHDELRAIAKPAVLARVDRLPEVPIAINVRCGNDFPSAPPGARRLPPGTKTPVAWFRDALRLVRSGAASVPPAFVVSDGTPDQLRPLLDEPSVTLVRPGNALSDLLTLARARVLLASGSSSFSAWGAFLGRMPTASHPGQPFSEWELDGDPDGDPVRAEVDPEAPDAAFLAAARAALSRR